MKMSLSGVGLFGRFVVLLVVFGLVMPGYAQSKKVLQSIRYLNEHPNMAKVACNSWRQRNVNGISVLDSSNIKVFAANSGLSFGDQAYFISVTIANHCPDVW